MFNTNFKLGKLASFKKREERVPESPKRKKSGPCEEGVVPEIPLASGFKYVGKRPGVYLID